MADQSISSKRPPIGPSRSDLADRFGDGASEIVELRLDVPPGDLRYEPPRNTGPIEMLVSGLLLAPEHPMPRTRNLAWCPLAE